MPDPFSTGQAIRVTNEHPPHLVTELWAWIITEKNGGEGVAACEMVINGQRFMMPLVGADEERIKSLEPKARVVAEITGLPVQLRKFGGVEGVGP